MGAITSSCCISQQTPKRSFIQSKRFLKSNSLKSLGETKSITKQSLNHNSLQRSIEEDSSSDKDIDSHYETNRTNIQIKNYKKRNMKFQDFVVLGELGSGSFGCVYLVQLQCDQHKDSRQSYAMKRIDKANLNDKKIEENTKLQKFILSTIINPFITSLKFAFEDQIYIYLVMQCAMGGPVSSFLSFSSSSHNKKNQRIQDFAKLGQQGIKFIVGSVVLAIQHLHNNQIMYRDLKPQNVIVFQDVYAKLTDFGLAKIFEIDQKSYTQAGTVIYFAPQIAMKQSYSKLVDFWTMGVFIYELATSQTPFRQQDILIKQKFKRIVLKAQKSRDWKNQDLSPEIKDIINRFLKFNPQQRLGAKGFDQIKQHAFFKQLNWKKLQNKQLPSPLLSIIKSYPFRIIQAKKPKLKNHTNSIATQQHYGNYDWNFGQIALD